MKEFVGNFMTVFVVCFIVLGCYAAFKNEQARKEQKILHEKEMAMVAKNEQGFYVFGSACGIEISEVESSDDPYVSISNASDSFVADVEGTKRIIQFLSRFVEMAEQGRLSTKIKKPEMTVTKEVVGEEIVEPFLDEEKKDEGNGGVSEGLEGDSQADKGPE